MILFISHYAGRTGAPIALLQLLRWMRQNTEIDFDILLQLDGELANEFKVIAPTYVCVYRPKRLLSMRNASVECSLRLPSAIRDKKYNLIYANTIANGSLVASSFSKSIPLITHCHEMDYWMDKLSQNEMPSTLARTNEFIACSNPSSGCLVKRGVLPSRIHVIPEPFTVASNSDSKTSNKGLRQELGIPDDSFVVISGGAEPWRKGKDLFVQLGIILNAKPGKRFDLIWLGEKSDTEFEYWLSASADYANVAQYLHWPGLVNDTQSYFSIANVFCMLSREDPMPLIAIEAGALGLPVICFALAGGTADWVCDSGGGRVLSYLDVGSVANAIREYSNSAEACAVDGTLAKKYCLNHFSMESIGPQIANIIKKYLPKA